MHGNTNYLHLFDSSGLIAKLSISQGNIPCNLCFFNIREFTLKKCVNKNFILLFTVLVLLPHPLFLFFWLFFSLCFAYPIAPPPFSLFFPSSFLSLFGILVLLLLSFFPSFCLECPTISHTLSFFHSFWSYCNNIPSSFFLLYLSSQTYTHSLFLFFCLTCPTAHSHNLPLFIPFTFFMLPHTHLSSFFYKHKKEEKQKEKLIWNARKSYCLKKNKKTFGRRALKSIAP